MIRYRARWIVPVTSPPEADGVVAVNNDRIVYAGPAADAPPGDEVHLGDVILVPGLINAHCHLELTAMRGFLEDLDFRRWILRLTSARQAVLDREALLDSARYGIEEGLRAGITTYADTSDSAVGLQAMRDAAVRGIVYQEVFGPDPAQCAKSIADLREKVAGLRYLETPLVRVGVSPHAPYTVSDDLFKATASLAREMGLPVAVHIAESEIESRLVSTASGAFADGLRRRGISVERRAESPIALLDACGVLEAKPLLIHCVRVNAADVERIASSSSSVAHCPVSNAKLGHGVAPLLDLLEAGIPVGLGSDSMASNNRMDLLEEARVALLAQRAAGRLCDAPQAADMIELATIAGARALGIDAQVGSLEEGKQADLAAFAIDPAVPIQDPVAALVFSISGARARFVTVAGKVLVRNGEIVSPRAGLAERMQSLADALAAWLDSGGELRGSV
ncbi:MAG TPA: amidohydrolase family protein [Gemmatimonadaceae bacterium]